MSKRQEDEMSGLGGLKEPPDGSVPGLMQLQLPVMQTPEHCAPTAAL